MTQVNFGAESQIAGVVLTPQGQPVSGAVVMITGDSPPHPDIAALTNQQGAFQFGGLLPGSYTLLINAEGFPSQTKQTAVERGETARLEIVVKVG